MLKHLAAALALTIACARPSLAAEVPPSVEECFKVALDLADAADEKQLADPTRSKVDDLLSTMEGYCEASDFTQATTISGDIEATIARP